MASNMLLKKPIKGDTKMNYEQLVPEPDPEIEIKDDRKPFQQPVKDD